MSDDWGKSFCETCIEIIFFEPSVKGKPTNLPTKAASAKTAPAPPPVVKKPAVRSKWDGEDEEEDTPVVSLVLLSHTIGNAEK